MSKHHSSCTQPGLRLPEMTWGCRWFGDEFHIWLICATYGCPYSEFWSHPELTAKIAPPLTEDVTE